MGILSSKIVTDPETGYRSCDMILWGEVSRDASLSYTRNKNAPKVEFGVRYGDKKFMNVAAIGDYPQTAIASRMEKGDFVLCAGIWEERPYKNKNGENKTWCELKVSARFYGYINPMGQAPAVDMEQAEQEGPVASALGDWQQIPDDDDEGELPW